MGNEPGEAPIWIPLPMKGQNNGVGTADYSSTWGSPQPPPSIGVILKSGQQIGALAGVFGQS